MKTPESIRKHKPSDFGPCCIQRSHGHYYVYEATSHWENGKPVKDTGKCLGKITEEDGFIPNAYGRSRMPSPVPADQSQLTIRRYGAAEMLRQLSPQISDDLRRFFPSTFREIRTIALLRLTDGAGPKIMQSIFQDSYLSELSPDLHLGDATVRRFIASLGLHLGTIEDFMRASIMPGSQLVFDGTSYFAAFQDSLSERGYNPDHRTRHQVRQIYVMDRATKRPQFYRILQGSMVDKTAFADVIRASGCRSCLILADKGFYSKQNVSFLMKAELQFILPLQSNSTLVPPALYDPAQRDTEFAAMFVYKNRPVFFHKETVGTKGNFLYTFFDPVGGAIDDASFVSRTKDGWDDSGSQFQNLDVLRARHHGIFSYISNVDTHPREIYLAYKERWDIEELYDALKNILDVTPAYAHTDASIQGWAFINHISALYFYGLIHAMHAAGIDRDYSPHQVLMLMKNIDACRIADGEFFVSRIQKKTQKILNDLGVDLTIRKEEKTPENGSQCDTVSQTL